MKHTRHILLIAAALITTAYAVAPGSMPVMASRAAKVKAVEDAQKAVADFDAQYTEILGEGWHDRLMKSMLSEGEEMAAAYVSGPHFDYPWNTANAEAKQIIAEHLLAKPTLDTTDLNIIRQIGTSVIPQFAPREAEILALIDPMTLEHYRVKYAILSGGNLNNSVWMKSIKASEWLTLASGEYDAATYTLIRDNLLLLATEAMVEKRKAGDQDTDGPEFDTAMAPIVAALSAPLFEGLTSATEGLGLDLSVPDFTATTTRANRLAASIERRTVTESDAKKAMGTVMFVKGVEGYNEWADNLTKP